MNGRASATWWLIFWNALAAIAGVVALGLTVFVLIKTGVIMW